MAEIERVTIALPEPMAASVRAAVEAEGRTANWNVETWGTGQLSLRGFTNGFLLSLGTAQYLLY